MSRTFHNSLGKTYMKKTRFSKHNRINESIDYTGLHVDSAQMHNVYKILSALKKEFIYLDSAQKVKVAGREFLITSDIPTAAIKNEYILINPAFVLDYADDTDTLLTTILNATSRQSKLSESRRINESDYDDLADQIEYAAKKLNDIRTRCKELDPDYEEDLIDPSRLDISDETLGNLQDAIENEQQLLDIYLHGDDDDFLNEPSYDEEPTDDDLSKVEDSDIFDNPADFGEDEFDDVASDERFKDESDESMFIDAMTKQMKKGEDERDSFWLVLKSQPNVDYEAKVITKFKDNSFIFTILTIDGEDFNQDRKIALSDIDLEATDYSDLV